MSVVSQLADFLLVEVLIEISQCLRLDLLFRIQEVWEVVGNPREKLLVNETLYFVGIIYLEEVLAALLLHKPLAKRILLLLSQIERLLDFFRRAVFFNGFSQVGLGYFFFVSHLILLDLELCKLVCEIPERILGFIICLHYKY